MTKLNKRLLLAILTLPILAGCIHNHHHDLDPETLSHVPGWGVKDRHSHDHGMGSTHGGVAVGSAGMIYVSSDDGIFAYNDAGELKRSFRDKSLTHIHAMQLRMEKGKEYIYGARNNAGTLVKLDLEGHILMEVPFPGECGLAVKKFKPTAVAVKPNGNIFLADGYGSNYILEFDSSGNYLSYFGGKDMEDIEKFKTPHGLTIDTRYNPARLLVCDREKKRLVHFDLDGKFIGEVITGLRRPCATSIYGEYVAIAELQGRVVILDGRNEIVVTLGDNPNENEWANFKVPPSDWKAGVFTAPHGLCWDAHGNLYVQDWNAAGRVSKWTPAIP